MDKEAIIEYLSERRDYYGRLQSKEERKITYNPALRIEYMSKKEAFEEMLRQIQFGGI